MIENITYEAFFGMSKNQSGVTAEVKLDSLKFQRRLKLHQELAQSLSLWNMLEKMLQVN